MADTKAQPTETKKEGGQTALTQRERDRGTLRRLDQGYGGISSPFELFDRMSDEMDRWWDRVSRDFGFPRRFGLSRSPWSGGSPLSGGAVLPYAPAGVLWWNEIPRRQAATAPRMLVRLGMTLV